MDEDTITIRLEEELRKLLPESITIRTANLTKTFYLSGRAYTLNEEDPIQLMVEYQDVESEMADMSEYQRFEKKYFKDKDEEEYRGIGDSYEP